MADVTDLAAKPRWRLLVVLENGLRRTESLDFWERERLESQLAAFESQHVQKRRHSDGRPVMFEFSNRRGETLVFAAERYRRHEVVDLAANGSSTNRS